MLAQQSSRLQARRTVPSARRVVIRSALDTPRPSIDPMAAKPRAAKAEPGSVWSIQTPEDVDKVLGENKDRLVMIMCKASHCKPCKNFMPKYQRMAELLTDSVLCELTGDMTQELKKMMISWGVKSTPTFRMYRNGELVGSTTGSKETKLLPVLTELLLETEQGKRMQPEDLEDPTTDDD